ncbi:MAG TPA: NAD(P)-binding domain-containing protein [Polyangiaceae bacterium]|nr:NAD(P)-binding domain-containing protein [Polyangiaceae bacterium]
MARDDYPHTCLIGAGSSGIAVAKALADKGLPFDCFEKSDRVGGNWVFKNKNGMSSAYRSLHINTSKTRMAYADLPMPDDYPDFPHHEQLARYFDAYVDRFDLRRRIAFERGVARVEKLPGGDFRVTLEGGEERRYDAVLVANGHHWHPRWPEPPFPGEFEGVEMHSHDYIDPGEPHDLCGKRVVVVGMGNSAMDIACELGRPGVAARVYLSARRGAYVFPNYLFGRPADLVLGGPTRKLPYALRRALYERIFRLAVGKMEDFGLPKPEHRIDQAHPTVSSELLAKLGRGDVWPRPNLAEKLGRRVRWADGRVEEADAIVYCTGYKVSFPFFDERFVAAPDNDLPLFRRVFKPGEPGLGFVGLVQPLGAIMPIAEAQGRWLADYLAGEYALPSEAEMRADMARERRAMFARYVPSQRHTMQVDFDDYLDDLAAERERGRERALARGRRPPVPARATG